MDILALPVGDSIPVLSDDVLLCRLVTKWLPKPVTLSQCSNRGQD